MKKVVINQINMAAEVFFDCFEKDQLLSLDFEDCFKIPPIQKGHRRSQNNSISRNTQWEAIYSTYAN